jgi:tetratricopeptide (TPR) repeat protein
MPNDLLTQGIAAIKAGNIQEARRLLDLAIRASPNDERTWGMFYGVCINDDERLRCLREVLRINPNNEIAKQNYKSLVDSGIRPHKAVRKINKKGGMSNLQKNILGGFAFIIVLVLVGMGVIIWPDITTGIYPPTKTPVVLPARDIETSFPLITSTERPSIATRTKVPTWTPIPSRTLIPSFTAVAINTTVPTQRRVAATSAPIIVKPDCSAQYTYIESLHQYYLDYLNNSYDQTLSYYQSLLDDALRDRDARTIIQIMQQIDQINVQRDSDINTENSRYESDRAYLDAQCK